VKAAARIAAVAVVGLGAVAAAFGTPAAPRFSARVDNSWFPLTPGTVFVYRGVKEGNGDGSVWYLGESTAELDRHGRVTTTDGSWQAGVRGARAGLFVPARPRVGQSGRQEYLVGHAEDHFRVVSLGSRVAVPYVTADRALLIEEWTPLEPGVLDHRLYVRGVGVALEQTVRAATSATRSSR
jgi:hypothetical protein